MLFWNEPRESKCSGLSLDFYSASVTWNKEQQNSIRSAGGPSSTAVKEELEFPIAMTNDLAVTPSDPGGHLPPSPDLLTTCSWHWVQSEPIRGPHPDQVTNERPAAAWSLLSTILAPCRLFISQTPGPWAWGTLNWKPSGNCICLVSVIIWKDWVQDKKYIYCIKSCGLFVRLTASVWIN